MAQNLPSKLSDVVPGRIQDWPREKLIQTLLTFAEQLRLANNVIAEYQGGSAPMKLRMAADRSERLERDNRDLTRQLAAMTRRAEATEAALKSAGIKADA